MITKYSLVVAPLIFSLAEIVVLRTKEKMRWSSIFKNRFIYLVPLISTGFYMLISLISFAPQYGWTWKNVSMVYAPFFLRIDYGAAKGFQFDFLANFSFLEIHMTPPWFMLMTLGLYLCLKNMQWQSIVMWSWFVGFMAFITFINWDYHVQYLFPVMPACYFFSLYGVKSIYGWAQRRMAGGNYFPVFRIVALVALLAWPVMNLIGEIQSLTGDLYRNKTSARIAAKVKELTQGEKDAWYIGDIYAIYKLGEQIHPQDKFYKIYHMGPNALSFLSSQRIMSLPGSYPYEYSTLFKNESTLIYYPGPRVWSKFLPKPDSLPSIFVGKIEPLVFVLKKQSGLVNIFSTSDGLSEIRLTSVDNTQIVIELSVDSKRVPVNILWFKVGHRLLTPTAMERNLFYFTNISSVSLSADRNYFERIQEITLLRYQAEEL
jgi:hypothetical protein